MSSKIAQTKHQVIDLIKHRWSARSFTNQPVSEQDLHAILEAGSWAPSANNSQPWRYVYAHKGTPGFDKIVATLAPGNQPWAKNAAVLIAGVGIKETVDAQQKFFYFMHDMGMANSFMLLQGSSMDIYGHVMAGFSKPQMAEMLALPANEEPVCVIAMGYLGSAEDLEEPYKSRELAPRTRKTLEEFTTRLD
jgi:nitroreductase